MSSTTTPAPSIPDGQEIINRVFIGGLARDTSELELENFFAAYGEVSDVRIVCDRKTGYNKGYGFVTFTTTQARDALLEKGTIDYKGGRKLRLRKAVKKETGGQFFSLNNGSINTSQNGGIGGQIVLVPVMEPAPAPAPTPIQQNPVCYIQQPNVNYHNFMAQQYNWTNCPPTGQVYYYYY
ncbi:protein boule-like [Oculina patagonica]